MCRKQAVYSNSLPFHLLGLPPVWMQPNIIPEIGSWRLRLPFENSRTTLNRLGRKKIHWLAIRSFRHGSHCGFAQEPSRILISLPSSPWWIPRLRKQKPRKHSWGGLGQTTSPVSSLSALVSLMVKPFIAVDKRVCSHPASRHRDSLWSLDFFLCAKYNRDALLIPLGKMALTHLAFHTGESKLGGTRS